MLSFIAPSSVPTQGLVVERESVVSGFAQTTPQSRQFAPGGRSLEGRARRRDRSSFAQPSSQKISISPKTVAVYFRFRHTWPHRRPPSTLTQQIPRAVRNRVGDPRQLSQGQKHREDSLLVLQAFPSPDVLQTYVRLADLDINEAGAEESAACQSKKWGGSKVGKTRTCYQSRRS